MDAENKVYRFEPDYAVSPGALLSMVLEDRDLESTWLAEQLGIESETFRSLLQGETPLTEEFALGLERVLTIPAYFWQKAETAYRIRKRKSEEKLDDQNTSILNKKPIRKPIKRKLALNGA